MNAKTMNFVWGLALVVVGGLFLAINFGLISVISTWLWVVFLGGLSVLFFASYVINGVTSWPWLFPAAALGGVAGTITLSELGLDGGVVATPILGGLVIPFLAAFLADRKKNWWALIPGWVMLVVAIIPVAADWVPGEVIGTLVLLAIAIPFAVVYLLERRNWWALIPAGVLGVVALIPLLTLIGNENLVATMIMLLFSLPFLAVFMWRRENWWALIPAGVFLSIALTVFSTIFLTDRAFFGRIPNAILFFGFAATFFVLWLLRQNSGTDWAKYPAAILALVGIAILVVGEIGMSLVWPVIIIAAGTLLLLTALRPRKQI